MDTTYPATSLAGWHVVGDAAWRAAGGEYVGTPTSPAGGWLMLDTSLQDVGVIATFRCAGGCRTGVLLRAVRTATGYTGVYVALAGEDTGSYAVTLDPTGRELSRAPLRTAGGQIRFAPPPPENPPAGRGRAGGGGAGGGRGRGAAPTNLPLTAPTGGLRAGDWNLVEILLDASIMRPYLNQSSIGSTAVEDDKGAFGPVAFFVGGTGEVRYRDVATSDLALKTLPVEQVGANFRLGPTQPKLSPVHDGSSSRWHVAQCPTDILRGAGFSRLHTSMA
jgi:hypothetical protein